MIEKLIFAAILGAVIGYITNWLAIKMLFRPHNEKRIGNMKVPFTPGLIPKEQSRIAKSVGEAVGSHLLTSDTMVKALKTNGIDEKFKKWVELKVKEIEENSISIREQIKKIIGNNYEKTILFIKIKITKIIIPVLNQDKSKIEDMVIHVIKKEVLKSPSVILNKEEYVKIIKNIENKISDYKECPEFKNVLSGLINGKFKELQNSNKKLNEIIPLSVISTIKVYIYNKNYDISMSIKEILKDDKISKKIKEAIKDIIGSNLSPMVAMFLNADTLYEKISSVIEQELDKEETQRNVALFIKDLFDKILEKKASNIFSSIGEKGIEEFTKETCTLINKNIINKNNIHGIFEFLEKKIKSKDSIEEILVQLDLKYEEIIRKFIKDKVEYILSQKELEDRIYNYVDNSLERILDRSLCEMSKENKKKILSISSKGAEIAFNKFLNNKAGDFMESFNIKKIVEDKINSFEVSFAEKIILEIASKELNAITWLGALLGSIMGLVSTLIASL